MPTTLIPRGGFRATANIVSDYFGDEIPMEEGMSKQIKIFEGQECPVVIAWVYIQTREVLYEGTLFIREYCLKHFDGVLPIIYVIDFVSEKLRKILDDELEVYWLDMSGNGHIDLPELKIFQTGNPNKYATNRLRDNPSTPAGARVLKELLMGSSDLGVLQLAAAAGVDQALSSRLLKGLAMEGWVDVGTGGPGTGGVVVNAPTKILDHWREKHVLRTRQTEILTARIEKPSVKQISKVLDLEGYGYAWTMMPAVRTYTGLRRFSEYTVYLNREPYEDLPDYLEADTESKDPNLRVIVNARRDTFDDLVMYRGVPYVNPFRAYCDLKECEDPKEAEASKILQEYILKEIIHR